MDLKTEKGKEIIKKIAAESDVVIENFRTGVMERLGLDYSVLKKVNPESFTAITGFRLNTA